MSRTRHGVWAWVAGASFFLLAGAARGQIAPDSVRWAIKAEVVPLLSSTYEVEVERRLTRRLSFTLAPRLASGPAADYSPVRNGAALATRRSDDRIWGYALALGPRLYIPNTGTEGAGLAGLYVGLKGEYQHLQLSYRQETWGEDLAPDGLRYYVFRPRDFAETIDRVGGALLLGYQCQVFHPRLRLDLSAALKVLRSRSSAGEASRYQASSADYAYSGAFASLGLGLGFVLK